MDDRRQAKLNSMSSDEDELLEGGSTKQYPSSKLIFIYG